MGNKFGGWVTFCHCKLLADLNFCSLVRDCHTYV